MDVGSCGVVGLVCVVGWCWCWWVVVAIGECGVLLWVVVAVVGCRGGGGWVAMIQLCLKIENFLVSISFDRGQL
ncbi:hypothetical protein CMV_001610 [Castanea mollissima]|uniref:Transmembrane protein n=1 Tax=Castanea mollissima TaxID=60419 RepID=A0A8J4W6B7_9ROSI|nr:hypothetical protein CMV_001610 [Castanea mollissima]